MLSKKRANVRSDYVKVPCHNLSIPGMQAGKKYPVAGKQTADGRPENRRFAVVTTRLN